jgi:hypothetical protein
LTTLASFGQINIQEQETKKIKIPNEWIKKLTTYDYKSNNSQLIKDFEIFIKPDTLVLPHYKNQKEDNGILNPITVNLDNDEQDEIIALIGWTEYDPMLTVFKKIDENWYLIFTQTFHVYYSSPELIVANVPSKNKTFYIKWLYERGSGIYRDSYHFYKLINGKVYHCLEIVNKAHIFGWGLYLNQQIQSNFKFNSATADELWVTYEYNFFPGAVYSSDAPWDSHTDIPFVKDEKGIKYKWDSSTNSYRPEYYKRSGELDDSKIECFGAFGNDSLFVSAFSYEILQTLEKGTKKQKELLTKYLELSKTNKTVPSPTGEIEQKGQTGGLKLYGTKMKE